MVPALLARIVRLRPRVLDRHALPHIVLHHRRTVQAARRLGGLTAYHAILVEQAQSLAGAAHAVVLALEVELLRVARLGLVQLPGAMDGPVTEGAEAGEAQWAGGLGVLEVVADLGCEREG